MAYGSIIEGMKVTTRDGHELGKIIRIDGDRALIEKGFFFPKDYEVPVRFIEARGDEAFLSLTKDELSRGESAWTAHDHTGATSEWRGEHRTGGQQGAWTAGGERAETRVQLAEEELEARKTVREAGEVRVRKDVVTERREIDVPVMREEVHVERTPLSAGSREVGDDAFRERTISVPVREEEVEVVKRPVVREEVRISKSQHTEERRISGDVRREEAHVERSDDGGEKKDRGWSASGDEGTGWKASSEGSMTGAGWTARGDVMDRGDSFGERGGAAMDREVMGSDAAFVRRDEEESGGFARGAERREDDGANRGGYSAAPDDVPVGDKLFGGSSGKAKDARDERGGGILGLGRDDER